MEAKKNLQGELVLMDVPAPLLEIVSDGHKRFGINGRVIRVAILITDGVGVHELCFTDSDAHYETASAISAPSLDQLPINFHV